MPGEVVDSKATASTKNPPMVNSMKMRLKMASGMDAAWKSPYLRQPISLVRAPL